MTKIYDNGKTRDMTSDEEAQLKIDREKADNERAKAIADKEAKDNLKASAKSKLIAGEPLTEEEAATIVP